jgi:hypothetical protein
MELNLIFNPISGTFDYVNAGGGTNADGGFSVIVMGPR